MLLISAERYIERMQARQRHFELTMASNNLEAGWVDRLIEKEKAKDESTDFQRAGSSALIPITGSLSYKYDFWAWWSDGCSYQGIINKTIAAASDESVDRIIYLVDSPGGYVIGCSDAAAAIFAARDRKEIISYVDPECCSAAYWLASQANRIVSMSTGQIGSIGAMTTHASVHRMYEEEGIDIRLIRSKISPNKNAAHPYEPIKEDALQDLQARCDLVAEDFLADVARGRGISRDDIAAKYGGGKVFYAKQALECGMIDQISSIQAVLSENASVGKQRRPKMRAISFSNLLR